MWDVKTGYNIQTFTRVHAHRVFKVLLDRQRIVSSSYDDTIVILDFATPVKENGSDGEDNIAQPPVLEHQDGT